MAPGGCSGAVGSTQRSQGCGFSCSIFSHPNVLPVLGACQCPPAPHPIVVSHWMPYGSLYNVLHEETSECWEGTRGHSRGLSALGKLLLLVLGVAVPPWRRCCAERGLQSHAPRACPPLTLPADFVVDQMQAVKFAFDIARGMAFLHTLEPLIPRHHLNSRSIMVSGAAGPCPMQPGARQAALTTPLSPDRRGHDGAHQHG